MNATAIWHDLECGRYQQDLTVWLELAAVHGDPVLDVGAGTGRVTLALADAGHRVVALDLDPDLLTTLSTRASARHPIECVTADARTFDLGAQRFPLIIAPMQTLQLLGGEAGHVSFLERARAHLTDGGVLAVAIAVASDFEEFEWHDGDPVPLPDIAEIDGSLYSSQPTAVRREGARFVLERRRDTVDPAGARTSEPDRIELDVLTTAQVEHAGRRAGMRIVAVRSIPATAEHIGSEVVVLGV